jgi:SAM-dependent methyltransferase
MAQDGPMTPELARVLEIVEHDCTLAFIADARVEHATLSPDVVRSAIPIRPGHLVLVADNQVVYRAPLQDYVGQDLDAVRERCVAEWHALTLRQAVQGDPRRVVADGYNRIAERYAQWSRDEVLDEARPKYLSLLLDSLQPRAEVLELGCGGGVPTTQHLAARFRLTGVDISERQIELARQAVPHATFVCDDMTRVSFPPASFDAVASFYAFNHLPYGALSGLFTRIGSWLRRGGLVVTALAHKYDPGSVEADWLGAPMYFSGYAPAESRCVIEDAGLSIISLQPEPIIENGRPTEFLWAVARKP